MVSTHTVKTVRGTHTVITNCVISEAGSRYTSRLYVNSGETATLSVRKATTLAGAMKQIDGLLKGGAR